MKNLIVLISGLFVWCSTVSFAQQDSIITAIESLILSDDQVAANEALSVFKLKDETQAKRVFENVSKNDVSYLEYRKFVEYVFNQRRTDVRLLSDYLSKNLKVPTDLKTINYDYVIINWIEINWLLEDNYLEESAKKQKMLEEYIAEFNPNERDVKRANILLKTYHLVMSQIGQTFEKSKEIALSNEKIAREIKDTNLIVQSLYYYSDFLVEKDSLNRFIVVVKEAIALDSMASSRSFYYTGLVTHLINAYQYQGGNEKETLRLLNKLYYSSNERVLTYSYFPDYVGSITIPSPESKAVFSQFGVTDLNSFANKIYELSKDSVNEKELYYVEMALSSMFEQQGDLKSAIRYIRESNIQLKITYSEKLGKSIAAYETSLLKQKQELELSEEQEKTNMYSVIAVLSGFLLVISVLYLLLRKNKEKELEVKNKEITKQRDEIKVKDGEKSLLLKEIHHRVKNNFQVVSSLLELQSAGIEDEKARALAIESKNRINSMALIHKKLYENDDLQMFFDEYVSKLVIDLSKMYGFHEKVRVMISVPHISFDIDTAIPLGLIINELTSNSFKYGMTNENPMLEVSILETGSNLFLLHVRDNGKGLPENFSLNKLKSLGLQLVKGLSRQLMGELAFDTEDGTHMYVTFESIHAKRMNG